MSASPAKRAYDAAYRAANREELRAKDAIYRQENREAIAERHALYRETHREEIRAWGARWRAEHPDYRSKWKSEHPEAVAKYEAGYRERNPEKTAARDALNSAIKSGAMSRGPCEECGVTENIHGHHDDYSKPLNVQWLCREHHDSINIEELS